MWPLPRQLALILLLAVLQQSPARAESAITILSIEPRTIGSNMRTQVTVRAQLRPSSKLDEKNIYLYHIDEYGAIIGDSLCQLFDDGDSRHADDKAKDGIYSCFAWLTPRWPTKIGMMVRAKYNGLTANSDAYVVYAVDGEKLVQKEHDVVRKEIMVSVRKIWARNKSEYGATDAAVAASIREIKILQGVHEARLGGGGDIFIYFDVGGRDQIPTFANQ